MNVKKISILSALAASSCCLPPLILLGLTLIGVGTAGLTGFSSTLGAAKWYILPVAIAGLAASYYLYFREKKKCADGSCEMQHDKFTKTMLIISTIVVVGFTGWSVYPYVVGSPHVRVSATQSSPHLAIFAVDGMTCGGCEIAVNGALQATGLVDSVKSSFTEGKAYVWYSDTTVSIEQLKKAIAKVGYTAELLPEQH